LGKKEIIMNIGTKVQKGKVVEASLDFSSGKKVILTPKEWEELQKRFSIIEQKRQYKEAKERLIGTFDINLKEMKL